MALFAAAILTSLTVQGQEAQPASQVIPPGFPHDWSSERLVFSRPDAATAERLRKEPRYLYQQLWRNLRRTLPDAAGAGPNRKRARRDWSEDLGGGPLGGITANALSYPAKYTFTTASASCSDFVVFNAGKVGSTSQPTIVAYTNLYSGCGGTVSTVYWQYDTAYPQGSSTNDGSVALFPVDLSADGSQAAFVQQPNGDTELVVLKWSPNPVQMEMNGAANNVAPSSYPSCSAPCMTVIPFYGGTLNDDISPPFYDYANDVIYVGDYFGNLHKFTGVFLGTPAEVTTGGWPAAVST
jgi:hypothetical protein